MRCSLPKHPAFFRFALSFSLAFFCLFGFQMAGAQTSISDAAIPQVITPSSQGSQFFVLNKDRSILGASTYSPSSYALRCAAVAGVSDPASATTPFTFNDRSRFLVEAGQTAGGTNTAVAVGADYSGTSCIATPSVAMAGTAATLSAVDTTHSRVFVLSKGGTTPDVVTHFATGGNYYSSATFTKIAQASLDTGGTYSSMVADGSGNTGYTAITQLRTDTSPGALWIYDPSFGRTVKVLGPGDKPLPAVASFIIHNPQSVGGNLLVLINQDNLSAATLGSPTVVATPVTIIDLGQLGALLNLKPTAASVTLPFVQQITSNLGFYAVFGGAFNPVDGKLYLLAGGGTSAANVVKQVIRYDLATPGAPGESAIADLTAVPLNFGTYPQIVLNAAAATMQILTSGPAAVYTMSLAGGDTATPLVGATFGDSNFQPTYLATNPLMGETYIASGSGQVDIVTLPAGKSRRGLLLLDGPSSPPTPGQSTSVRLQAVFPVVTSSVSASNITVTAVAARTGSSFIFATTGAGDVLDLPRYISGTFPTADVYTLTASFPGDGTYPAIASAPVVVGVGKPLFATQLAVTAVAASSTAGTATITLSGSTYTPSGTISLTDAATGSTLATYTLPSGALINPLSIPFSFSGGTTAIIATYNGDAQNSSSTSAVATISGPVAKSSTSLVLTAPAAANSNTAFDTTVAMASANGSVPTGQVVLFATKSGSTPSQIGSASTTAAFGAGTAISASLPAGTYLLQASYPGDASFNSSISNSVTVVVGAPTAAAVSVNPASLSFSQAAGTTSGYKDSVLTNTGGSALSITGITATGAGFAQVNGCPASLAANTSCTIRVTFSPSGSSGVTGAVTVTDSAAGSPHTIALSGTGFVPLALAASATSFTDQTVGTSSFVRPTLTLTNNTGANLTISKIASDNPLDFEPGPGCVGAVVANGSSCTVLAIFHPASAGAKSAGITFTTTAGALSAHFTGAGLAAGACLDTDGDALCDEWEKNGVWTRVTGAPDQFIDLPAMGADPMHKDIFVHVDYMQSAKGAVGEHSHQFKLDAQTGVVQAFLVAPVSNPDKTSGIHLHIDCGAACIMNPVTGAKWGSASKAASLSEQAVLDAVPGESANDFDWTVFDTDAATFKATGRDIVFHHSIMAHDQKANNSTSGVSRNNGRVPAFFTGASDFNVTLGSWNNQTGTSAQQSGTMMHELGHNLGLAHGGRDGENYKPNYLSVMNYNMQTAGLIAYGTNGYLDYSRWKLPDMNEFKLSEVKGLGADSKTYPASSVTPSIDQYGTYYFCMGDDPLKVGPHTTSTADGPIDWNCDGSKVFSPLVATDVNGSGGGSTLASAEDWSVLAYAGGAVGGNGVGVAPLGTTPSGEITQEQNSLIVPPYAVALTGMNTLRTAPGSQPTLRFVITNNGSTADTYTLSATTLGGWAVTPGYQTRLSLLPGAHAEVTAGYTVPASAATGSNDTLIFRAVSQGAPLVMDSVEVGTYAEASPAPLTVSAASLVFGAQSSGSTSASGDMVLMNTGTAPLTVASITASAEFTQANTCPATLATGASCTVSVQFQPAAAGMRTGTLSIATGNSATRISVALRGTGIVPALQRPAVALAVSTTGNFAGQPLTLVATAAATSGSVVPSGTVTFYSDDTMLGQAAVNAAGSASLAIATPGAGTYNVYAAYSGDKAFNAMNTPFQSFTLAAPSATAVVLQATAATTVLGSAVTFTANVAVTPGTVTPTGTVTFFDGATRLGTGTVANGAATLTTSSLPLGTRGITATYSGDAMYLTATSSVYTETVIAAGVNLSASVTSITVTRGSNVSVTLTATPTGIYSGTVSFSCGTLPAHSSCTFAPATLTFTQSGTAQSTTLTFATKDAVTAMLPNQQGSRFGIVAAVFLPLGLLGLLRGRRAGSQISRARLLTFVLAAFALAIGITGCGSNGMSNTTGAGTYAVPVTATVNGTASQVTLNITVQ